MSKIKIVLFTLLLAACNNPQLEKDKADRQRFLNEERERHQQEEDSRKKAEEEAQKRANEEATKNSTAEVEAHIGVNPSTMAFSVTQLSAKANQNVHIILENKGTGPLPHNWMLVNPGTEAQVAADCLNKGEKGGYVAEGPNVLAFIPMITPGHTADVRFKAPSTPGKYPYICSFPGHYLMMKGTLEVTP